MDLIDLCLENKMNLKTVKIKPHLEAHDSAMSFNPRDLPPSFSPVRNIFPMVFQDPFASLSVSRMEFRLSVN